MRASWTAVLGALDGAIAAALAGGLLVGVLGWHLDSTFKASAFLAAMLVSAIAGWSLGAKVVHRRAPRTVARAFSEREDTR
jgi:F0F1-type ATP synthase assembly protein I